MLKLTFISHTVAGKEFPKHTALIGIDDVLKNMHGESEQPAKFFDRTLYEAPVQIARMIAVYRQAQYAAEQSLTAEAELIRAKNGYHACPVKDFPAYVVLEDGEPRVHTGR